MATDKRIALAVAGGAITIALIDKLVEREVLSREDALALLKTAQNRCGDLGAPDAAALVGGLYTKYNNR
jgi:hypothetical protein